jgi:hypothetical protein
MRSRTKTQSSLPSEDAVFLLLFGLMHSGQVTLRRLVGWQDLKSLKSQAAVWQLDTQLLNSPHSDAKPLFHHLTDTTNQEAKS